MNSSDPSYRPGADPRGKIRDGVPATDRPVPRGLVPAHPNPHKALVDLCGMFLADIWREEGITVTQDATEQLAYAFVPALRIMCERGYDPAGLTWRNGGGWMGLVFELKKKTERLWWRAWRKGEYDKDVYDIINYAGMYARADRVSPWGSWGPPHFAPDYPGGRPESDYPNSEAGE